MKKKWILSLVSLLLVLFMAACNGDEEEADDSAEDSNEGTEEQEAVGDDGYRRIRTDIVFGRLRPGQKLRLEGLKEDYGVSVSTLREILSRLAAEGFVLAEGRRGFEVAAVSAEIGLTARCRSTPGCTHSGCTAKSVRYVATGSRNHFFLRMRPRTNDASG